MKTLLLAADTARSKAYAQALQAADIEMDAALLLQQPGKAGIGTTNEPPVWNGDSPVQVPDLGIALESSCRAVTQRCETIIAETVNAPAVIERINVLAPDIVIYSGFGGQLVGRDALALAPFLHVHSGWLPEFRGSTTVYYSIIAENACAATAILLSPQIDMGGIVARKQYPMPPKGMDIDYLYDPAIRADLLLEALETLRQGRHPSGEQREEEGTNYYVIHPVLKHIALLSLDG